jgi:uncharacterized protein YjbJ (UPF0337 family)
MRPDDLHHKELLELDPEGGVIRFARQGLVSSTLRVKTIEGRIKELMGKLVGNKVMEKKSAAEKNATEKKVLYEDLKGDVRKLARRLRIRASLR